MAYPPNTSNHKHSDTYEEHAESLKPRSKEKLYPSISDINFSTNTRRTCTSADLAIKSVLRAPPQQAEESNSAEVTQKNQDILPSSIHSNASGRECVMSPRSSKRCSISSIQTLPSDCSAEDLSAIQAALHSDEEEEGKSMALVQQLIREELGLPPQSSQSSIPHRSPSPSSVESSTHQQEEGATTDASPKPAPKQATTAASAAIAQDLIYQICLQLDEVNVDVKSENWQMLAPHEIDKLEILPYNGNSKRAAGCLNGCEDKCLVCQQDYEHQDSLRKLRCGHYFHQECVDPWLLKRDFCPVCRKTIDED